MFLAQVDPDLLRILINTEAGKLLLVLLCILVVAVVWLLIKFANAAKDDNKAQNNQQQQLIGIIATQETTYGKMLREIESRGEDNYIAINATLKQNQVATLARIDDLTKKIQETIELYRAFQASEEKRQETMARHSDEQHKATRDYIEGEIMRAAIDLADTMAQQRAVNAGIRIQFPSEDDPRWEMMIARPSKPNHAIRIYDAPIYNDKNVLGTLRHSGEVVRTIIDTIVAGWHPIIKAFGVSGDQPIRGWIEKHSVSLQSLKNEEQDEQ